MENNLRDDLQQMLYADENYMGSGKDADELAAKIATVAQKRIDAGLMDFLRRHSEWSQSAFGSDSERGPQGPLKHLVKEVTKEILPDCDDIVEFADAFMLLMDAMRRAGFSFDSLLKAANEKLEINRQRVWPVAGKDDLVEHTKQ